MAEGGGYVSYRDDAERDFFEGHGVGRGALSKLVASETPKTRSPGPSGSQYGVGRGVLRQLAVSELPETRTPGPRVTALGSPQFSSTPYVDHAAPQVVQNPDLDALLTQLAEKLGDSITAKLQSQRNTESSRPTEQPAEMTLPNVNVVMQSDRKEPPIFRGDSSDKFTVHEWENLMTSYLKKRAIPVQQQSEEILAKLMGKAGDVVRIKLRNTSIDHTRNPDKIFDILKQHFSELTYSSMPLADFYNTFPKQGEDVMEYWIRLNKTVDVADECLKRQGRSIHDPSHEVCMMFIKHCPDQTLANVFKFKSAGKWSASEIQERLDEHMQDKKTRAPVVKPRQPTPVEHKVEHKVSSQCQGPVAESSHAQNASVLAGPPPAPPAATSIDNDCMRSLVSLLDRLVTQTQAPAPSPEQKTPCRLCGTLEHSTFTHCRRENRCRYCLSEGHIKVDCPKLANKQRPVASAGDQNLPLNERTHI